MRRPRVDVKAAQTSDLTLTLNHLVGKERNAVGQWVPEVDVALPRRGLRVA